MFKNDHIQENIRESAEESSGKATAIMTDVRVSQDGNVYADAPQMGQENGQNTGQILSQTPNQFININNVNFIVKNQ